MAKDITGFRVAHADVDSVANAENTIECDFDLARGEAIALYRLEFKIAPQLTETTTLIEGLTYMSVHIEADNLEDNAFDQQAAEAFDPDSEILAESVHTYVGLEGAAGEGGVSGFWGGPVSWNYLQMFGSPLVIATNPTLRAITNAATVISDVRATFYYKYVELSDAEIREAFFRQR